MRVVELSGGVGGARMARGFAALVDVDLTIVVNVGDDLPTHGLHVAPDLDTVVYTLAGIEGPQGWGRAGDSFVTNSELARFGVDNRFQLGDLDLALKIYRTNRLARGDLLSEITDSICSSFDIRSTVIPATNDPLRTMVTTTDRETVTFQTYFVERGHRDHVQALEFQGAEKATAAPGVIDAITSADLVVIGPSNPPLSIWPILAVPGIEEAIRRHPRVMAVSPLIGGTAVKGPAAVVLADLGMGRGTAGVLASYRGLANVLVVDDSDRADTGVSDDVSIVAMNTLIEEAHDAERLAQAILGL